MNAQEMNEYRRKHPIVPFERQEITSQLTKSVYVPSELYAMQLCTDFMIHKWFLSKFGSNEHPFFHRIYIQKQEVFKFDKDNNNINDKLKPTCPQLSISYTYDPQADDDWTNNLQVPLGVGFVDLMGDRNIFFSDPANKVYLKLFPKLMIMKFRYQVKLETQQQLYAFRAMMETYLGARGTQNQYIAVDYDIPPQLINDLAHDLQFAVNEKGIPIEPQKVLDYLNTYSDLPWLYKLKKANGFMQYFIRIPGECVKIKDINLDIDEGDTIDFINEGFQATLDCTVRFPSIQFYTYSSIYSHQLVSFADDNDSSNPMVKPRMESLIKSVNEMGWNRIFQTDYTDEGQEIHMINFGELFYPEEDTQDRNNNIENPIKEAFKYCKMNKISPASYVDLQVYLASRRLNVSIDWDLMNIYINEDIHETKVYLVAYADKKFMNDVMITIHNMYSNNYNQDTIAAKPEFTKVLRTK